MAISFIRVDDRLIHGEIITRWLNELPCDGVIAVDDKAAADPIISNVLKSAVPGQLRGFVMPTDRVARRWSDITKSPRKYFLIARSPVTFKKLYEAGADLPKEAQKLNVGPMSERPGAKSVAPNANVTKEELDSFNFLADKGMTIEFQLVPDSKKTTLKEVNDNFNK